jgi:hypothetical protein
MPIVLPALALISGTELTTDLRCAARCHGTASLRLPGVTRGSPLAQLSFKLTSSSTATLHLTLSSAARTKLAHLKQLAVQLTVVVTVGSGRPNTFTSSLELTRTLPRFSSKSTSTQHAARRRATRAA